MNPRSPRLSRRAFTKATALAGAGLIVGAWPRHVRADLTPGAASIDTADLTALKPLLQELVREMEEHVPYAAALVTRRTMTGISVDDRTREIDDLFPSQGAVFTVHNGSWFEESATSDLDPSRLREVAMNLARNARTGSGTVEIDPGTGGEHHFRTRCEQDPRELPLEARFARITDLHTRCRQADPSLVNTSVDYSEAVTESVFVNRSKVLSQDVLRLRLGVSFYASDGSRTVSNFNRRGGTGGLELVGFTDEELAGLARESHVLLEAGSPEPGEHDIVVDGSVAGTIAHESFGHGVELDMFVKDRALAEEYLGKRVGSDLVNIYDDPSLPGAYGTYFFDDEGHRSSSTHIVENGVFERGLSDLMSATELDVSRTANGRRQDTGRKAYARMSNTFFGTGTSSVEDLVGSVGRGYLLERFTHGMEDPKGWGIQVSAHVGREIVDGAFTGRLVSPVSITGYVPEVLGSVSDVSRDFEIVPATCGKGHKEYVPVSTGGPHLRLRARLA